MQRHEGRAYSLGDSPLCRHWKCGLEIPPCDDRCPHCGCTFTRFVHYQHTHKRICLYCGLRRPKRKTPRRVHRE